MRRREEGVKMGKEEEEEKEEEEKENPGKAELESIKLSRPTSGRIKGRLEAHNMREPNSEEYTRLIKDASAILRMRG